MSIVQLPFKMGAALLFSQTNLPDLPLDGARVLVPVRKDPAASTK